MKPGIYYDLPAEEYHAVDAVSNSLLSEFRSCPKRAKYYMENGRESTKAMQFGTLMHWGVLEPDKFRDRTVIARQCESTTGKGTRCTRFGVKQDDKGKYYCGTFHGKHLPDPEGQVVKPDDITRIRGAYEAVQNDAKGFTLTTGDGNNEVSLFWIDPGTSLLCKARVDRIAQVSGGNILVDLKTTRDASPYSFSKSVKDYGYYRQCSWYLFGANELGLEPEAFYFVVVESKPPFMSAVYDLTDETINHGWDEIAAMLPRYAECKKTNTWPGYTDEEITSLALPSFAQYEIEQVRTQDNPLTPAPAYEIY